MRLHEKQRKVFQQADIHSTNFSELLDLEDACSVVDGAKKYGLTKEELMLEMKRNRA